MIKRTKAVLSSLLLTVSLGAVETTLTNISFIQDDNGNLNPNIFIPIYYGETNQFYSAVGYTSGTSNETGILEGIANSKTSLVSNRRDLTLNYLTYVLPIDSFSLSFGLLSEFSNVKNNDFAYFETATAGVYAVVDNQVELDIWSHRIELQALIPMSKYVNSRFTFNVSPYTTINSKQTTNVKPLVNETGQSSSSTSQDISYAGVFELQTDMGSFIDFGFIAAYSNEPLKYKSVSLATSGTSFEEVDVDNSEVTTKYLVKVIIKKNILGGLNPSIGYGVENLDVKNNITGDKTSTSTTIFTIGVEKRF